VAAHLGDQLERLAQLLVGAALADDGRVRVHVAQVRQLVRVRQPAQPVKQLRRPATFLKALTVCCIDVSGSSRASGSPRSQLNSSDALRRPRAMTKKVLPIYHSSPEPHTCFA
jgi:hypothetical protein